MKQKKSTNPTSQVARDEARKFVEKCVYDFLENSDEAKALALLEKAQLCIADAKSIEREDRTRRIN